VREHEDNFVKNVNHIDERYGILQDSIKNTFLADKNNIISNVLFNFSNLISNLNTDLIYEGSSNLYYNDVNFNRFFNELTFDNMQDGSLNRFIVNDKYCGDLNILGVLTTSNIDIMGDISIIHANIYQSGSLLLTSSNGVNLQMVRNKALLYNNNSNCILLVGNNYVGINNIEPLYELDVSGIIISDKITGEGKDLYDINIKDKSTSELREGSNLYFTDERLETMINVSNLDYYINEHIVNRESIFELQSNYISNDSNVLILQYDLNYYDKTSNDIMKHITDHSIGFSNNVMMDNIYFNNILNDIDYNASNSHNWVSYDIYNSIARINISNYIASSYRDISNYIDNTCNIYYKKIDNVLNVNQSNYYFVCNKSLYDYMFDTDFNLSNCIVSYLDKVDKYDEIDELIGDVSQEIMDYSSNILEMFNKEKNIAMISNLYRGDKILHINFSNVIIDNKNNYNFKMYNQDINTITSNIYFKGYNKENENMISTSNVYLYNNKYEDANMIVKKMNNEGFVIHFAFKADYTQNTPIFYIGNNYISLLNIKLLYGYLYVCIGNQKNSIVLISSDPIYEKTWYIVDIVASIVDGFVSMKMYLNAEMQSTYLLDDSYEYSRNEQTVIYNDALKYVNQMVVVEPLLLPIYLENREYYIVFDSSDYIYNVYVTKSIKCDIFMIGGGGGGGYNYGGGGGAGAYYYSKSYNLSAGNYTFKVGGGGVGESETYSAANGGDTVIMMSNIDIIRCRGGGHGGSIINKNFEGGKGGCGGGGIGWDMIANGSRIYVGGVADNIGTSGIGNAGGNGYNSFTKNILSGGGGGGIGGVGQSASLTQKEGGNGGDGLMINIRGRQEVYGGGGGGGEWATYTSSPAGLGGGAIVNGNYVRVGGSAGRTTGQLGENGKNNTGSGGGSGKSANGGFGGSGIIIIRYTEEADLSIILGCSNLLDTFEDNNNYSNGIRYTNTYYSNSLTIASNYEHFNIIYNSNSVNKNIINAFDLHNVINIENGHNYYITDVETNIVLKTGFYFFRLDIENIISADLFIGKHTDNDYINVANYYDGNFTSNMVMKNPLYIVEGYYRMHLRMMYDTVVDDYLAVKYSYSKKWNDKYYNLFDGGKIRYMFCGVLHDVIFEDIKSIPMLITSNVEMIFAGNKYNSCNLLNIQDFKILNNPMNIGAEYSIKNILYNGYENGMETIKYKIRVNKWQEVDEKKIYYNEGNVGIGNTIPSTATLDVQTGDSLMNSIKTNKSVWTNTGVIISSDERIKKNMIDMNDDCALGNILKIEPKIYNYVENRRSKDVYGFIAQQIKDIIPNAVRIEKTFIPNIYSYIKIENDVFVMEKMNDNDDKIKIGDRILLIDESGNRYIYNVVDKDGEMYSVKSCDGCVIRGDNIFAYGTYVNDFHVLDKSYIYTMNIGAIQELYRRHMKMEGVMEMISNYDSIEDLIKSFDDKLNCVESKGGKVELCIGKYTEIMQDILKLRYANIELMKSMQNSQIISNSNLFDEIRNENIEMRMMNEKIMDEYNELQDCIINYKNEIISMMAIMKMKNIL
jgi:hypothetical protein